LQERADCRRREDRNSSTPMIVDNRADEPWLRNMQVQWLTYFCLLEEVSPRGSEIYKEKQRSLPITRFRQRINLAR